MEDKIIDQENKDNKNVEETTELKAETGGVKDTVAAAEKPVVSPRVQFAKRVDKFSKFYLFLLCIIGGGAALAIAIAVVKDVVIGGAIGIITALVYKYFVNDELNKSFGVSYRSAEEQGVVVTRARVRYGDEYWIPKRLMYMDVTEVDDKAFRAAKNSSLKTVHLPKTLKRIGKDIFDGCASLECICFEGDEMAWDEIVKETDLDIYEISFGVAYPRIKKKNVKNKKK